MKTNKINELEERYGPHLVNLAVLFGEALSEEDPSHFIFLFQATSLILSLALEKKNQVNVDQTYLNN